MEKIFGDAQTFVYFIFFFVPGFVSYKTYDILTPSERRDFSKAFLEVVSISVLYHAFFFAIFGYDRYKSFYDSGIALFLVIFVGPFLIGCFWYHLPKILSCAPFARRFALLLPIRQRMPTAWDHFFSRREPCWVIIHFKDGLRIGGRIDERSFASAFPQKQELYLEMLWHLDEFARFTDPVERSKGAVIQMDDVKLVEFFNS